MLINTGNISRKVLSKVLRSFDKNFERLHLRTLLYDREIILLDEPFGALDAQTRQSMQNWLLEIWEDFHKTVLFVTHDMDEAIYLSDIIYVFSGRPGYVKEKITVHLKRPRKQEDMLETDFWDLKQHLMGGMSDEKRSV